MPYFQRKPYQETLADLATAHTGKSTPDDTPFRELARSVLDEETGPKNAIEGPFRCKRPIPPGGSGIITLNFAADDAGDALSVQFTTSDLHGPDGAVLPADLIDVKPEEITLRSGQSQDVTITIIVPNEKPAGRYHGRVTALGSEPTSIVIEVDVADG